MLSMKISRGPVILPASIGMAADPLVVDLSLRLFGPRGPVGPAAHRQVLFDVRTTIDRDTATLSDLGLEVSELGIYAFEIRAGEEILTIVPLLVVPHGTLAAGPPPKGLGN